MAKYDDIIAGAKIGKNPELPVLKKIVLGSTTKEMGPPPEPKIKRLMSIRETDNGYVVVVDVGDFHEEWVFNKLSKVIQTATAYFKATVEEE